MDVKGPAAIVLLIMNAKLMHYTFSFHKRNNLRLRFVCIRVFHIFLEKKTPK